MPTPPRSLRRKLLFAFLPLLALLLLMELGFWIFTGSSDYPLKLGNVLAYSERTNEVSNREKELHWPAPSIMVRHPDLDTQFVEAPYRIGGKIIPNANPRSKISLLTPSPENPFDQLYIVGGSAAFGYGYHWKKTFAASLGEALHNRYQVINAAQVGWNSGQLLPVVRRIADHPNTKVMILFTGNNEWVQWTPLQEEMALLNHRWLYELSVYSHTLSFFAYQSIMKSAAQQREQKVRPATAFISQFELEGIQHSLANPIRDHTSFDYTAWVNLKNAHLGVYEQNLTEMVRYAKERGIRVILMNIPFNYKLSPAWKHPQPLYLQVSNKKKIGDLGSQAVNAMRAGDFEAALLALNEALRIEPEVANLHYIKGQALESLGRLPEAEAAYALCREHMVGNLGSILSINATITKVAQQTGVELIDLKTVFDDFQHSRGRYFNDLLLHDDCHPTWLGHQLIAEALFRTITGK